MPNYVFGIRYSGIFRFVHKVDNVTNLNNENFLIYENMRTINSMPYRLKRVNH